MATVKQIMNNKLEKVFVTHTSNLADDIVYFIGSSCDVIGMEQFENLLCEPNDLLTEIEKQSNIEFVLLELKEDWSRMDIAGKGFTVTNS